MREPEIGPLAELLGPAVRSAFGASAEVPTSLHFIKRRLSPKQETQSVTLGNETKDGEQPLVANREQEPIATCEDEVHDTLAEREPMLRNRAISWYIVQFAFVVTTLVVAPASAEQSFDNVAGSWSGGGLMKPSDGPSERVRCKVEYSVKNAGQSVKMDVRCASDAYKMDLSANIDENGTTLSGNWFESQYRQGGKVSGQNVDGRIEARVEGETITALLTVQTKGNRQTFVMDSPGAWVSHVEIDLARDSR